MTKFKYLIMSISLTGFLVGCGSSEEHDIKEIDPIPVDIGVATIDREIQTIQVSGRIEAANSANVSTRMMGNVTKVVAKPGDAVRKGDLLVAISSEDLKAKKAQVEASIAQARSGLENAEMDYKRFSSLFEKGSASKKELENMTTRYEMAQAGLEAAQQMKQEVDAQFVYTNLRAPFAGVVTNTFVKEGDIARPGMPLVTVEGTNAYEATVMVPESQIGKIKTGAKATVLIKSKDLSINGEVVEVSLSAKNTGGQFLVKIAIAETEHVLPGMFINANIAIDQLNEGVTPPMVDEQALVRNGQLTGIYTLGEDNKAILRWVRTGNTKDGQVEMLSGISKGEKYILKQEGKLYNGATVLVNN